MTPPDARVLIVAALIIAGVPVALHEFRMHAHHTDRSRSERQDTRTSDWGATNSAGAVQGSRPERGEAPGERPSR